MNRAFFLIALSASTAFAGACSDVEPALQRADRFMQRTASKVVGEDAAASRPASAPPAAQPAAAPSETRLSPEAAYRLGLGHLNGEGVAKDERRAAELLESAAERGHRDAQYILGITHARQDLPAYDPARAVMWLSRAGEGGHPLAANALAAIYAEGRGVPKEPAWAAVWYRRAAERGHADSAFALGLIYVAGGGVARDIAEAHRWLAAAERANQREAKRYREALETKMTHDEIAAAKAQPAPSIRPMTPARIPDEAIVRFVQYALSTTGGDPGAIDGRMGPATRAALAEYRKGKRLRAEANLSSATVEALRADLRRRG